MTKILFICHGNICRSSAAEYVMKDIVKREGREDEFHIESKGTSAEELGNGMYPPMERVLSLAGIDSSEHIARRMRKSDYDDFDLIIGMDHENLFNMQRMWPEDKGKKIHLLMEYANSYDEVSDPWYTRDFSRAYNDIKKGCEALYLYLVNN